MHRLGSWFPFSCRHSKSKNNSSFMDSSTASSSGSRLPCLHSVSKKADTSPVFRHFFLFFRSWFFLLFGFGLDIAAMPFELHVLAAGPALSLSTLMFLGCQMTLLDDLHTFHASDQTLANRSGIASRPYMLLVTPLPLELSMAVLTSSPGLFRTNGRKSATLALVRTQVFFVMIIGFLPGVAKVAAGEESRHLGDNVIMIVVHVEVNFLVFLRTTVNYIIAVLFRHDIDLTIGQVRLELFGLFNPAWTERHASVLVEYLCQTRLH